MLALQQYIEFVMHLIAVERIARGLRMVEVVQIAKMIQALHAGFQARWKLPSPALETRMVDYLVELSVIRPACY
ncbi:MAG: hypothetical protein JWN73_1958 [Betaproteobacteria bacterium]|nr:hypothetical protein [Betaproteobacteria bacterium]